jgi:hypothetical protein
MPDLQYQVEGAAPERFAAAPLLLFKLRIDQIGAAVPVQTVILRCQIRVEPQRRSYSPTEQERLVDLFGTTQRWGQTVRPMLWTHAGVVVPSFTGTTLVDLPVPCTFDFNLAATKYFDALQGGDIPLCFLFSGTVFYEAAEGLLQAAQIPWDREAHFRLPATTWRGLMEAYYPNSAWLTLRKDIFDQLADYRSRRGLASWEQTLESLLAAAREPVAP